MRQYASKRALLFVPTLLGVSLVIFLLMRAVPGDYIDWILSAPSSAVGVRGEKGASQWEADMRTKLGLDRPLHVQYLGWMGSILKGDFGFSLREQRSVRFTLLERFPATAELAVMSIIITVLWAIPLGILGAVRQHTLSDYASRVLCIVGLSVPHFWLGVLVIFGMVSLFNTSPPTSYIPLWEDPWGNFSQFIWPALILAYSTGAPMARMTRSQMLEVLREDYVRTGYAKGLTGPVVIWRHALRNALIPVVTIAGWFFARLLGGTVVMETVFNIPGMGRAVLESVQHRDLEAVGTFVFVFAAVFLVVNLVVDLAYGLIDPRIRYA